MNYRIYEVPNGRLNDFAKGYTGANYPDACKLVGEYESVDDCRDAFQLQIGHGFDADGELNGAVFSIFVERGYSDDIANAAASAAVDAAEKEAKRDATEGNDPTAWGYDLGDLRYLRVMAVESEEKYSEVGWLFSCDKQGNNCEPLNADDEPYSIEDADSCCDTGDESTIRRATIEDDCDARVTHVAVNPDGEIVCYFRFRTVEEAS